MRAFHKDIEEKYGYEKTRVRNTHTDNKFVWKFRFKLD
jgi:hypothetical protein